VLEVCVLVAEEMALPILKVFNIQIAVGEDCFINIIGDDAREDIPMDIILGGTSLNVVTIIKKGKGCLILGVDVNNDSEQGQGVR